LLKIGQLKARRPGQVLQKSPGHAVFHTGFRKNVQIVRHAGPQKGKTAKRRIVVTAYVEGRDAHDTCTVPGYEDAQALLGSKRAPPGVIPLPRLINRSVTTSFYKAAPLRLEHLEPITVVDFNNIHCAPS